MAGPQTPAQQVVALSAKVDELTAKQAVTNQKLAEFEARPVYKTYAEPIDRSEEGKWGFRDLGHFAAEVMRTKTNGGITPLIQKNFSQELVIKAATGMGELVGSDGGFLVPPQFSNKIFERLYKENDLLKRTDQYTVGGNSIVFPRNSESSRANGSRWGGVQAYWLQEGSTITRSRPTFGRLTLNLHKLACLAAITEELMQDSGLALNQYLGKVFPAEISFLVGDALVRGTGAGQPLGIKNSPCTVTVTRDTASHVVFNDIENMWARRFKGMGSSEGSEGFVWFINQDVSPDLGKMTLGIGTAGVAAYQPPGMQSAAPYMTLKGAPVVEIEWCDTLGTSGDIILADMGQMVSISKGGMETQSSMHLYFDSDQQAFRTTFRMDSQSWWSAPLTPYKGTNTQSPFIILS